MKPGDTHGRLVPDHHCCWQCPVSSLRQVIKPLPGSATITITMTPMNQFSCDVTLKRN